MAAQGRALPGGIALALLLRLAWVLAEVIHGAGHSLARWVVDQDPEALCLVNVLEHRSPRQILIQLLPFAPIGPLAMEPLSLPWLAVGEPQPWKVRIKASGGLLLHIAVLFLALVLRGALPDPWPFPLADPPARALQDLFWALIVTNGWMVLASRSDHRTILSGEGDVFHCGNFGFVAVPPSPSSGALLPERAIHLYRRMGRETELRGTQAGGGLVLAQSRRGHNVFVGHKVVNAKRGDLTGALEAGFRRSRHLARLRGIRPHPTSLLACWHYRFGTSGPPAIRETHWQEWSPARLRRLHRWAHGAWVSEQAIVHHRITHNGDFEAFELGDERLAVAGPLGPWLAEVLGHPVPAMVDSARIAGMMDLLICQGDWFAAVRWGALLTLADGVSVPPQAALTHWAHHLERVFLQQLAENPEAQNPDGRWIQHLLDRSLPGLKGDPLLSSYPENVLRQWLLRSIDAFLHHTPERAVLEFLGRARGSFGLVVVSTTTDDQLVLSSLGQPITLGMAPAVSLAPYASEAAAVDSVLAQEPGAWRLDLDQNAGEIALLSSQHLRITSLSLERQLTSEEVQRRQQPYSWSRPGPRNPQPVVLPHRSGDPIASDLAGIPSLLWRITNDWRNPGSRNRQSAEALGQLLIAKAENLFAKQSLLHSCGLDPGLARSTHVDLLITGIENSLWLGEQFARDLTALMPLLSVRALSANAIVKALQTDMDSLQLARQSIVLVLSHSGQTFPSRQVMEACDLLVRREVIREVFLLLGEPESLLGSPLLAEHQPGEPFSRRLFTTGAGRRRAEPATLTVAAMHQTLTELLLHLAQQLLSAYPGERRRPLGLPLQRWHLNVLEDQLTNQLVRQSSEILGVDAQGQGHSTSTARQLERAGRRWGQHVLEAPLAWGIQALYIAISVGFGLPLIQTLEQPLDALLAPDSLQRSLLFVSAREADIALYIFGPWLWTLLIRWVQGRPLWARTGRRTVVVGDSVWIHKLLTNYVSKLFALSFGIASVDVQGGEATDELLHTQAHRVVRGSLLFLGVPDSHLGLSQQVEADAVILAARQSDGIRYLGTGPEIVAIGSDSAIQTGPFQSVVLLPGQAEASAEGPEPTESERLMAKLLASRLDGFRRLLAGYTFFGVMARTVASLPLLRFKWWKTQSRTKIMTTAAPISAAGLDVAEPQEIVELSLDRVSNREQS